MFSLAQKIRQGSMIGGVLGALGHALGGGIVYRAAGPGRFTMVIVYLTWQTGMGLAIGLVWPGTLTAGELR